MKIKKTDILWFAIILLLVLNLSTIGTIVYQNHATSNEREQIVIEPNCDPISGQCFRQNLNFNAEQMKEFRAINRKFRTSAQKIINSIEQLKREFFKELSQESTNQRDIKELSREIGHQHEALKVATAHYYLQLKEICNSEQQQQLEQLFTPLFHNPSGAGCCRKHKGAHLNNRHQKIR